MNNRKINFQTVIEPAALPFHGADAYSIMANTWRPENL